MQMHLEYMCQIWWLTLMYVHRNPANANLPSIIPGVKHDPPQWVSFLVHLEGFYRGMFGRRATSVYDGPRGESQSNQNV